MPTRMMPTFRQATLSDIPELAILSEKMFRLLESQQVRYPDCTPEGYQRLYTGYLYDSLVRKSSKGYVAMLEMKGVEEIVGYLVWSMNGLGITDPEDIPVVEVPRCTDRVIQERWKTNDKEFYTNVLKQHGPYFRGEILGVDMNARLLGVASGLSRILAAEVKKAKCPIFFNTSVPDAVSFYDRFATVHGYEKIEMGEPYYLDSERRIDKEGKQCVRRFRMVKKEVKKDVPIARYRRGSPE